MTQQTRRLSVIVPVYNQERALKECVNSILLQEYENIQVILVDDGSSDGSGKICENFALSDSRICVIHTPNRGVSHARNTGLEAADGYYVAFVDSDDRVEKNIYTSMVSSLEEHRTDFAVCAYYKENYAGKWHVVSCERELMQTKEEIALFLSRQYVKTANEIWNKLYIKEKITQKFDEKISLGEDLIFNLSYFENCSKAIYLPEPMYFYSFGNGISLTTKFDKSRYDVNREQDKRVCAFLTAVKEDIDLSNVHQEFIKKAFRYFSRVANSDAYTFKEKKRMIDDISKDVYWKKVFGETSHLKPMSAILKFCISHHLSGIICIGLHVLNRLKYTISK